MPPLISNSYNISVLSTLFQHPAQSIEAEGLLSIK